MSNATLGCHRKIVSNTVHREIYKRRTEWFSAMKSHHFVLWWVAADHIPDLAEACEKLAHFNAHGTTPTAFGWDKLLPEVSLWREPRCV